MHVDPAAHVVAPLQPWPPHCPYLATPPEAAEVVAGALVVGLAVLVTGLAVVVLPLPLPPELPLPVVPDCVLPMGPHLMLEKVTETLGEFFSTSVGAPEDVEQGPRLTPGLEGLAVVG